MSNGSKKLFNRNDLLTKFILYKSCLKYNELYRKIIASGVILSIICCPCLNMESVQSKPKIFLYSPDIVS